MTRSSTRPAARRGAILLVVITLIALFSVVALSFVLYAESEATAARIHRESVDDAGTEDLDYGGTGGQFASQLIYGGTGSQQDVLSGVYGNDLGRTQYVSNPAAPAALPGGGRGLPITLGPSGVPIPPVNGLQASQYAGHGAVTSLDDGAAVAGTPGPLPVSLATGGLIPREDIVSYMAQVDPGNGQPFSILPEVTGQWRFVGGAWQPVGANGAPYPAPGPMGPHTGPQLVSRAGAYTYPDVNNLYLAQLRPDTGELVTPSFHRSYVFDRRLIPGTPQPPSGGATAYQNEAFGLDLQAGLSSPFGNPNWYTASGRLRIARPRPWDQLTPAEQSAVAMPLGLFPIPENLNPAQAANLTQRMVQLQRTGEIASPVLPYPTPNADGTVTGDVQNLRTTAANQKADSVWLYLGTPPQGWRGRKVVPMVSATILDLSARVNLNVAANVTGYTRTPYRKGSTSAAQWTRWIATRSNLGVGPHEINLGHALRGTTGSGSAEDAALRLAGGDGSYPPAQLPAGTTLTAPTGPAAGLTPTDLAAAPPADPGELTRGARARRSGLPPPSLDRLTGQAVPLNGGRWAPGYTAFDLDAGLEPRVNDADGSNNFVSTSADVRPGYKPATGTSLHDPFPNFAGATGDERLLGLASGVSSSLLFAPAQWQRATSRASNSPHQYGFEEMRRAASRLGVTTPEAARIRALTELGGLMPTNLASAGGQTPGADGRFAPNVGQLGRALVTTFSSSARRAELLIPTRVPGGSPDRGVARLGPIDLNRPLPDWRVNPDVVLDPANMFPLVYGTPAGAPPAFPDPFLDDNNRMAYKAFAPARRARQNLAREIFVRMAAVTRIPDPAAPPGPPPPLVALVDGIEVAYNPAVGYLQNFDPSSPPGTFRPLAPAPGNVSPARFQALRRVAQMAANVVDYVDNDDSSTSFVWNPQRPLYQDTKAADPTGTDANCLNRAWGGGTPLYPLLPGSPLLQAANPPVTSFVDPSADPTNFNTAGAVGLTTVYGTELPRLVINEAYAVVTNHRDDLQAPSGPPGPPHVPPTAANGPVRENFRKRYVVELHNPLQLPLPQPGDTVAQAKGRALPEGGAARLQWFKGAPSPIGTPQTDKPTFNPYRLEVVQRDPNSPPLVNLLALDRDQNGNVTGELPLTGVDIRVDRFDNTGGTQPPPVPAGYIWNPTYLPATAGVQPRAVNDPDPANNNQRFLVKPMGYGLTPVGNGNGFFTVGSQIQSPAAAISDTTYTRLLDDPPAVVTADDPAAGPKNTLALPTTYRAGTDLTPANALRPSTVLLRRLANPHLPHNPLPPDTGYNPLYPPNPYVTVDVMDRVPAYDQVLKATDGTPPNFAHNPAGGDRTHARRTPYVGTPDPDPNEFADRQPTASGPGGPAAPPLPASAFPPGNGMAVDQQPSLNQPNQNVNAVTAPAVDLACWPAHMDRELVSPAELFHVSAVSPFELTARFAVAYQRQINAADTTEPPLQWHTNAHTLMAAFTGRTTYPRLTVPPPLPAYAANEGLAQNHRTGTLAATPLQTSAGPPPVFVPVPTNPVLAGPLNPAAGNPYADWHRLLDVLTTRSRTPGTPVGGPEPGRVNVNTIWDDRQEPLATFVLPPDDGTNPRPEATPPTSRMLDAVLDPARVNYPPGGAAYNLTGVSVKRNAFDPTAVAYMWAPRPDPAGPQPNMRLHRTADIRRVAADADPAALFPTQVGGSPELVDEPYQGFAGPSPTAAAAAWLSGSSTTWNPPVADRHQRTLVRQRTGDERPVFFHNPPPQQHTLFQPEPVPQHPYGEAEPLRKMLNSVSTTSDGFLVLMTVSFFEVRTDGNGQPLFDQLLLQPGNSTGLLRPLIGREAKREVPGDLRRQYVMIVDRSKMTAEGAGTLGSPTRPGPAPAFTTLAADAGVGEDMLRVTAATVGGRPALYRDGQPVPIPFVDRAAVAGGQAVRPDQVLRLGFGDRATDNSDGEPVVVWFDSTVPALASPWVNNNDGTWTLRVSTDPTLVSQPPLQRNHGAGSSVATALLAHPGPRPPLDLQHPEVRAGVVPYFHEVPASQ